MNLFKSVVIFVVLIGCESGCSRSTKTSTPNADVLASFESVHFQTPAEVQHVIDHALDSEHAVIFVNLRWATLQFEQRRFAQFALDYRSLYPDDSVLFHYLDCTPITDDYTPLSSMPGWKELEKPGRSLIQGYGELVWIRHGRVVHVEPSTNFQVTSDLIHKTEELFRSPERG